MRRDNLVKKLLAHRSAWFRKWARDGWALPRHM